MHKRKRWGGLPSADYLESLEAAEYLERRTFFSSFRVFEFSSFRVFEFSSFRVFEKLRFVVGVGFIWRMGVTKIEHTPGGGSQNCKMYFIDYRIWASLPGWRGSCVLRLGPGPWALGPYGTRAPAAAAFSVVFRGPLAPWLPGSLAPWAFPGLSLGFPAPPWLSRGPLGSGFSAGPGAGPASSLLRTIGTIRGGDSAAIEYSKAQDSHL